MTLNGIMAVTLRYFTEFGKHALQKTICVGTYAIKSLLYFLVRVQCCRKESSRSLRHLLMSFLFASGRITGEVKFIRVFAGNHPQRGVKVRHSHVDSNKMLSYRKETALQGG